MSNAPLRVFIGTDSRQPLAFNVAQASIWRHSSRPVSITPLVLSTLPIERRGLTEFSVSRYLVPWLCNFEGHALFIDGDTLCMGDIAELPWDAGYAVQMVKHTTVSKYAGQMGQRKEDSILDMRFERASVMLFDCEKCGALTPEFVQNGDPHKFNWTTNIGWLPAEWNHLVGYSTPAPAKLAHFTMGLPCFQETAKDEYAAEWQEMAAWSNSTCSWAEIMGGSVHARWKQQPPINKFMKAQGFR